MMTVVLYILENLGSVKMTGVQVWSHSDGTQQVPFFLQRTLGRVVSRKCEVRGGLLKGWTVAAS